MLNRILSTLGYGVAGLLLFFALCVFAWLVLKLQVQIWEWLGPA